MAMKRALKSISKVKVHSTRSRPGDNLVFSDTPQLAAGLSCSKKWFPKSLVSRLSAIRPIRPVCAR